MLGLTMTDIVIMTLGIVSLIIWLMFFIKGMKYNSMFDVLVEKEYPFKEIYGLGYAVLETIKYNYKSKGDRKLRQELDVLYGSKYSEYYLRTIHSQQITIAFSIVVLGTPKEWNVSRRNFTPTSFFSFLWAAAALW